MKCEYKLIKSQEGFDAIFFNVTTKKGNANGIFSRNRIMVHGIHGERCTKGLMEILTKKFKCKKVTFTPLINDNIKRKIRGTIKVCKADSPDNPYKEDFEYLETVWI